jgi:hypothetical protein
MIISHRHRFIFVKTKKTAGTSIELALREICGPDDVITPITREADEKINKGLSPQHWHVSGKRDLVWPWLKKVLPWHPKHENFSAHIPAEPARHLIGDKTWSEYFKFSVERNPWDRQVSHYYYHVRPETGRRMTFKEFMNMRRAYLNNYDIYSIDGVISVDHVMRYEHLAAEFAAVLQRIGISQSVELPRAKGGIRKEETSYREFYDDHTRGLVAQWYRREIEAFGYEF